MNLLWLIPGFVVVILVFFGFLNRKTDNEVLDSEGLENEMIAAKKWIVSALDASGYEVDFSIESLREVDRFFVEQNRPKGILARHTGRIIFALAVYVGETLIANVGGKWILENCRNQMEIKVKLADKTEVSPGELVLKRYQNTKNCSLYDYGKSLQNENE